MNDKPNILDGFPRVVPFVPATDDSALRAAALADNHRVIAPTHVVIKHDRIVGYGSIAAVPLVLVWLDSVQVSPRDSLACLNIAENIAAGRGIKWFMFPCEANSPFHPFMEKLGMVKQASVELYSRSFT